MYDKCDFCCKYFSSDSFVFYNKFNEGVCVEYPVYMYKLVRLFSSCTDFSECLTVNLVKNRC